MKILHITTHLNTGGITTYLLTLVREQAKAGHEVYVWASGGVLLNDFEACCAKVVHDIPRCKSELSPFLWAQMPRFVAFLKEHSIGIIHTHTRVAQVLSAVATRFVKVPYVSTAHMFYKRRLGRRLFPCWGRAVMAISQTMRQGLIDIFGEKHLPPVTVVRNGIDIEGLRLKVERVDRDTMRKVYGCSPEQIVILALSRLVPVKGLHILFDAVSFLHKEVPEIKVLVAGGGDEDYIQKLKAQAVTLGLQNIVSFLGNITETEKPFKAADIFVGPYLWPEAFGLSLLEAMASGLPVIGSNSGGITELLGYGKNGLLFEEGNVPELLSCLLRYAKDPELRVQMGKAASQAASEYSSGKMCEQIQTVYEDVLGRGR